MKLVGQYDSPFVRRVAVTLHFYGIPFERDPKSIFGDREALSVLNPLIRVPALILDDGEVLIDSGAILSYLDEIAASPTLTPSSGKARREVLQAMALSTGISEKVVALYFERYHHTRASRSSAWEDDCMYKIRSGLSELERRCSTPWYRGEELTQADVTIVCMLSHLLLRFPELFSPTEYPRLSALSTRCEAEEAFMRSKPSSDETVPS